MAGASRTISAKFMGDDAQALLAYIEHEKGSFNGGVVVTSGIKESDHRDRPAEDRFSYDYYCYALITFDLDPNGHARPTDTAAVKLFKGKMT